MALKNVVNALFPVGYGINKYREANKKAKEHNRLVAKGEKMAIKKEQKAHEFYKSGIKQAQELTSGKHGPTTEGGKLMHDYERFYNQAGDFLRPQFDREATQAYQEQNMYQSPELRNQYGAASGQGSKSSALNQALAAARTNLSRQLENDFSQRQMGLASGILQQREQNKQFDFSGRSNLAQMALNQPSAYQPPSGQQATGSQIWGPWATGIIGGIGGGMTAGPGGAVQGFQTGTQFGKSIWG